MIDIERRLQHAARELREVRIDPPPLPTARSDRHSLAGRLPTLVMPVLFVLGGLAIVAGGMERQVEHAPPAPTASAAPAPAPVAPSLTPRQEVALIASLGTGRSPSAAPADSAIAPTVPAAPVADLRSFSQQYR